MTRFALLNSAALATLLSAVPLAAQDASDPCADYCPVPTLLDTTEITVLGSRTGDLALEDYTGSVTVITAEQIEERQTRNIEDVLRDVPGVAVSSLPGQTQLRLRGSEANHVLVLVDGMELSDPGSGEYDLGTLQAEIGSRIEVLRGPQSALYGSEAIAGVIAYDSGTFDGVAVRLEGGTNNTINGAARWGVIDGGLTASLSASVVSTDGEPNARGGTRDIGRDSYTLSGKVAGYVSETLQLRAIARYTRTEGDFNEQDFGFGSPTEGFVIDSQGTGFESEIFSALAGARLETMDGSWVHDLSAQITDADRSTSQPSGFPSATESDRFKISYVSAYDFGGNGHALTFAADYEVEGFNNVLTFDDRKSQENLGFVGEYRYSGGGFDFSAAVRHDINDLFQDATTFRVGAGYHLTDTTRLRAAVGTGVKNPTLSELFGFFDGVFIGNPDLEPEESTSWEAGIDQNIAGDAAVLSVTYFNAELDSEIFTSFPPPNFVATPGNRTTESRQEGVEVALAAQIGPQWSLNAAYTYLDAEENGATEVRRPESVASAALTWTAPRDKASATLVVRHNGSMIDSDFTTGAFPAPVTGLDDFTLVNLNARVALAEGLEVFARAENLFDERYEQVFTFVSPGRQVVAGFSASF
ncbi:MAG: TonB-dependent receptor [Erythrobacteraceae bacterium]|nr:TonB-dependent receptor [Erythrobacteraceae bacterium]